MGHCFHATIFNSGRAHGRHKSVSGGGSFRLLLLSVSTESYNFQTLNYLHKHRVAHQDFSLGNLGMNLYAAPAHLRIATGVRDPQEVEYTVYDFGHSLLYPLDANIDSVITSRRLRYYHAPDPTGEYNPFKSDVAMMGGLLHGHVMGSLESF